MMAAAAQCCMKPLTFTWFREAIMKEGQGGVTVGSVRYEGAVAPFCCLTL
jgi:hypothetical protein